MRNPGDANRQHDNHGEIMTEYGDLEVGQRVRTNIGVTGTVWPYPRNYYLSTLMPDIPVRVDGKATSGPDKYRLFHRAQLEPIDNPGDPL
jgi:hypothetical protein